MMLTGNHFIRNRSLPNITFRRSPDPHRSETFDPESFHSQISYSSNLKPEVEKQNFHSQDQKKSAGSLSKYESAKSQKNSMKLSDIPGNIFSTRYSNQVSTRQKNELRIGRAREKAREVAFNRWERIVELRETLSAYQASEMTPIFPNRKHVQKVMDCLESLNTEDNELGDVMILVLKVLSAATYIDPHYANIISKKLLHIESKELLRVLQNSYHEQIPYYTLSRVMLEELIQKETLLKDKEKQHGKEIEKFKRVIHQKEGEICELNGKLNQTILAEKYNKALQERDEMEILYKEVDSQNTGLKKIQKDLEANIEEVKKDKENLIEEIKYMTNKITEIQDDHETTKQSLDHQVTLNVEGCERIKKYKKLIDTTIIKMSDFKQQITNLQHFNNQLFLQNKKLNVRAAAGFVNLTPRPDYVKLFNGNSLIEIDKKPTMEIFRELLDIVADKKVPLVEKQEDDIDENKIKKSKKKLAKRFISDDVHTNNPKSNLPENKMIQKLMVLKRVRSLSARQRQDVNFIGVLKETDSSNNLIRNLPVKISNLDTGPDLDILSASRLARKSSVLEVKPLKQDQIFEDQITKDSSLNQQNLWNEVFEDSLNSANKMMNKLVAAKKDL